MSQSLLDCKFLPITCANHECSNDVRPQSRLMIDPVITASFGISIKAMMIFEISDIVTLHLLALLIFLFLDYLFLSGL